MNDLELQFFKIFSFLRGCFSWEYELTDSLGFCVLLSVVFKSWLHHLLVT